jgi:long-chain acyl-CoA synthetase
MTTHLQPGAIAASHPDKPAVIVAGTGDQVTYAQLEERSRRLAQLLYARGLRAGDRVAILLENHPRYYEVAWAVQRSGMYAVPINWHLKADEAGYIIQDSGAKVIVTSAALAGIAADLGAHLAGVDVRLMIDGAAQGFEGYEQAIAAYPAEPLALEREGALMYYSSGTTGQPKGIMPPLSGQPFGTGGGALVDMIQERYRFSIDTRYLFPAPLYHSAPLGWSTASQRLGATVVIMERFEARQTLELIQEHRITHAQFVPTHFVRMLKLPEDERLGYDHASLQVVTHAAAPCPVDVKRKMLDWWGPVIHEFYSGSEGNGFCAIGPEEWLAHPGSVGRPVVGRIHVLGVDGEELPPGEVGQVWFDTGLTFAYHNDARKTASAYNDRGWSTLGDIGRVDEDGFLYLTDRATDLIISGGVNIYPREAEDVLALHPAVTDVAVIGVPDAEMGEQVKAVVVAAPGARPGPELAEELVGYCRSRLAHFKCPVSVDFADELPRLPTGKLRKRELKAQYTT